MKGRHWARALAAALLVLGSAAAAGAAPDPRDQDPAVQAVARWFAEERPRVLGASQAFKAFPKGIGLVPIQFPAATLDEMLASMETINKVGRALLDGDHGFEAYERWFTTPREMSRAEGMQELGMSYGLKKRVAELAIGVLDLAWRAKASPDADVRESVPGLEKTLRDLHSQLDDLVGRMARMEGQLAVEIERYDGAKARHDAAQARKQAEYQAWRRQRAAWDAEISAAADSMRVSWSSPPSRADTPGQRDYDRRMSDFHQWMDRRIYGH